MSSLRHAQLYTFGNGVAFAIVQELTVRQLWTESECLLPELPMGAMDEDDSVSESDCRGAS